MAKPQFFRSFSINIEVYSILYMLYTLLAFNYVFFEKIHELSQSTLFTIGTFFALLMLLTICSLLLFWKCTLIDLEIIY